MRPSVLSAKESCGLTAVFAPTDRRQCPPCSRERKTACIPFPRQSTQSHPCHTQATLSPNQPPEPTHLSGVVRSHGPSPLPSTFSVEKTAYTLEGARLSFNVRQKNRTTTMPFNIPGTRLIEEIIAGLPTNSSQALKLREFSTQMDVLKQENADLKAKLAALQPSEGIAIEAAQLLTHIFKAEISPDVHELTKLAGAEKGVVVHHLISLAKLGYIKGHRDVFSMERFSVTHEGSAFFLKHIGR
jgi:hypothetical protein